MKLVFLFIVLSLDSLGQKHNLEFDFYSDDIKLYAIGENHKERNTALQLGILEYLLEHTKVDYTIQELPFEMGEVLNDYV